MGKVFFPAVFAIVFLCAMCNRVDTVQRAQGNSTPEGADAVTAATARKGPPARKLLERLMPGAMGDGLVKIAVVVNLEAGDQSRQFIEGCVSEGRSMGFTVDAFVTGADEGRCRELAAGIAGADYDGLVFAYGEMYGSGDSVESGDFSWDILRQIAEKGLPIVTFEAFPYNHGTPIDGIISTFEDDGNLTRLSLDVLLAYIRGNSHRTVRVIRVASHSGQPFLDRRNMAFDLYAYRNAIEELALVTIDDSDDIAAALSRFPPGSVDALWSPHDAFTGKCVEALASLGRQDIKVVSIGISNDGIRLMQRYPEIWLADIAVDPRLAGAVNMRLLAAQLAGESLPDSVSFAPQVLRAAHLNRAVNIANIHVMIPVWGDEWGMFDHYRWMSNLKHATEHYLRIPPVGMAATR